MLGACEECRYSKTARNYTKIGPELRGADMDARLAWHDDIGAEHVTRIPTASRPQLSTQRIVDGDHCSKHAPTTETEGGYDD